MDKFLMPTKLSKTGEDILKIYSAYFEVNKEHKEFFEEIFDNRLESYYFLTSQEIAKLKKQTNYIDAKNYLLREISSCKAKEEDFYDEAIAFVSKYLDEKALKISIEARGKDIVFVKKIGFTKNKLCTKLNLSKEERKDIDKDNFVVIYQKYMIAPKIREYLEETNSLLKIEYLKMPYVGSKGYINTDLEISIPIVDLDSDNCFDILYFISDLNEFLENEIL